MADTNRLETPTSVSALVGGIITDAQQLIRQEVQLARREIQEEIHKAKAAALALVVGGFLALLGTVLLSWMLVHLLYWATNTVHEQFPLWACFGIVGAAFTIIGGLLLYAARSKAGDIHLVPPQTAQTLRENVQWIKNPR